MPSQSDFLDLVREIATLSAEVKALNERLVRTEKALEEIVEIKHRWRGATMALLGLGSAAGALISFIVSTFGSRLFGAP